MTLLEPGARAAGMGGTGVALPGDDAFNSFCNPAHLGDVEGIRWGHSRTQLVPDFSSDTYRRSDYVLVGAGGIGIAMDGRPFGGLGKTALDFGTAYRIDAAGDTIGTFRPHDTVREFALGFRSYQTLRHLAGLAHITLPAVDRYLDLSIGFRWKKLASYPTGDLELRPGQVVGDSGSARDWGVLIRLRPYHNIAGEYEGEEVQDGGPLRVLGGLDVELLAGYSSLNSTADSLQLFPGDPPTFLDQVRRQGVGVIVATGYPRFLQEGEDGEVPMLRKWLGPAVKFSAAIESQRSRGKSPAAFERRNQAGGVEATFLDLVSLRMGHRSFDGTDGDRMTSGFGLNLHYADAAAIRYDWASFPQANHLSRVHPWALTFTLNPYGVLKVLLGE